MLGLIPVGWFPAAIQYHAQSRTFYVANMKGIGASKTFKPDEKVFRTATDRFTLNLSFASVLFVTENPIHIVAAHALGMRAVHFKGPGQTTGEITHLPDLVALVEDFLALPHFARQPWHLLVVGW